MIINIFLILIAIAGFFLISGMFGKIKTGLQAYAILIMLSGIIFMIIGISVLRTSIDYPTGINETEVYSYSCFDDCNQATTRDLNYTTTIKVNDYTKASASFLSPVWAFGVLLILLSLFLILASAFDLGIKEKDEN